MSDILTLPEARSAVGPLPAADTSADSDLTSTYIPAATAVVESIIGPVMTATNLVFTVNGGTTSVLLPSAVTAVTQVTETGTVLVANVDYVVNLRAGVVTRGSMQQPYIFLPGESNIVITYNAGAYAAAANVPPVLKLAARKVIRQLWLSDRVGRTQYGSVDTDLVDTPAGFAIPRATYELLAGFRTVPGFA